MLYLRYFSARNFFYACIACTACKKMRNPENHIFQKIAKSVPVGCIINCETISFNMPDIHLNFQSIIWTLSRHMKTWGSPLSKSVNTYSVVPPRSSVVFFIRFQNPNPRRENDSPRPFVGNFFLLFLQASAQWQSYWTFFLFFLSLRTSEIGYEL